MRFKILLFSVCLLFNFSFVNAADYYWINGSGNWSQISHWATTSGGSTLHSTVPSGTDDVYFDANSFSAVGQTVSVTSIINFKDMDWTGATNNPTISGNSTMNCYGSIELISAMTFSMNGSKYYFGTGNHTLNWAGHNAKNVNKFEGTGTYSLNSDFVGINVVYFENGTFNSNGYDISCAQFRTSGSITTPVVNLGTSIITVTYSHPTVSVFPAVNFFNPNGDVNAGNAAFKLIGTYQFTGFHSVSTDTIGSIHITTNAIDNNFATNTLIDSIIFNGVNQDAALKLVGRVNYISSNNNLILEESTNVGKCEINTDFETEKSPTIDTLILKGTSPSVFTLADGETLTITDSIQFPIGNCKIAHTLTSSQPANTATLHKAVGFVNIDYVSMYSVIASGSAIFTGINIPIDNGKNTGWTISTLAPTSFYWVGGTGDWTDPTQWSLSSGGAAQTIAGCLPGVLDSVFFDANSFNAGSQIVDVNDAAVCGYMDWTGVSNTPTFSDSSNLSIYGSLIASASMNWDYSGELVFRGNASHVIDLNGQVLKDTTRFSCSGTYSLLDSLNTEGEMFINGGIINTNDYKIRSWRFFVVGIDSVNLMFGKSRVEVGFSSDDVTPKAVYTDHNNAVFDMDETTFVLDGTMKYTSFFTRRTRDFGNVYIHRSAQSFDIQFGEVDSLFCLSDTSHVFIIGHLDANYIYAENELTLQAGGTIKKIVVRGDFNMGVSLTVDTFVFDPRLNSRRYILTNGRTLTITDSISFPPPSCNLTYYLGSNIGGTPAIILKNGGTVTLNYASLISIAATGTATYTSSNTLADDGNNTGWTINNGAGVDFYWVGGTGDWSDPTQWSLTSGGAPQLATGCLPSALDNVFFDANSFTAVGQIVTLDIEGECGVMNWTGATNNPSFEGDEILYINDSLELINAMSWDLSKRVDLLSQNATSINFAGQILNHNLYFNGSGSFNLRDSIHSNKSLTVQWATINTNDHKLHFLRAFISGNSPIVINMGKTLFEYDWVDNNFNRKSISIAGSNVTINGAQSTFYGKGVSLYHNFYCATPQTFGNFIFDQGASHFYPGDGSTIDSIFYLRNFSYIGIRDAPTINYLHSNFDLRVNGNATIGKAVVTNNFSTFSSATIDTLLLIKTGGAAAHELRSGDTLTIGDSIFINSNGCFSHGFEATSAGVAASVLMPAGKRFVTDFVSIKDLTAIGGGTFDAGKNSTDLGNNTGWTFANEQNTFKLKYKYYCLIPSMTKIVKTDPDGMPTKYWWRNTVNPYDTFNTYVDTIQVTTPGDYVYVMEYGGGCTIEDSVFVRDALPAMGVHQVFKNNAKDEDWFNCSNWDNGLIPDSISNATIDAGDTVRITKDTAWCYDLTINGVFEQTGGVIMVFGDIVNNGTINQSGGKFVLAGNATHNISGLNDLHFDSLVLAKNGFTDVSRDIIIHKHMGFEQGYIFTYNASLIRFEPGAKSNEGSSASYVIGPVEKRGTEAFVFPIGKSDRWARLGISDASVLTDTSIMRAEYFNTPYVDTSNYASPLVRVSHKEYWVLDKLSGLGAFTVKLYYEDAGFSGIANIDSATVVKYSGGTWTDMVNNNRFSSGNTGWIESNYVNTFSPFTFGTVDNNNPLPVDWLGFDVKLLDNTSWIEWSTANEIDNNYFVIERSFNNIDFDSIGKVKSQGINQSQFKNYHFKDVEVDKYKKSVIFYRIKQVDINGTENDTKSKFVLLNFENQFIVFPNPTASIINIKVAKRGGDIIVRDAQGRLVLHKKILITESYLDLKSFTSGIYSITYKSTKGSSSTQKLIIK